jgi:hypothetical protein
MATTTGDGVQTIQGAGAKVPVLPMILRGEVIDADLVEFRGRGESLTFLAPDPHRYLAQIPSRSPSSLLDLLAVSFDEIVEFLVELGERLDVSKNAHMQWAREFTYRTSPQTRPIIDNGFRGVGHLFSEAHIREMADRTIGIAHLDGWVDTELRDGTLSSVRAFGARTVHIIPGNGGGPAMAADTIIRGAFTRSDNVIKSPSNNPFTPAAIGRTMCEMAPDHPITKHLAIAYWQGGDDEFEQRLYQPHNVEKIVAWGGLASVKHVTRYIQPGLELISLDPKYSASVVGSAALSSEATMREAALRIAVDVGTGNQTTCSASRVVYVLTDGLKDGVALTNRLGEYVYEELMGLPEGMSTKPKRYDSELRVNVESLRLQDDWYRVIGGERGEGSVIVSQLSDPIDFTSLLADRTVNIVPVETLEEVLPRFDSYTQTIGVYPEELQTRLRDIAPLYGVQRLVPLGYSSHHTRCGPHDGMELDRRLCKWIVSLDRESFPLSYAASADRVPRPDSSLFTPTTLEAVRAAEG